MDKYSPSLRFKAIIESNICNEKSILSAFPPVALFQRRNDLTVPVNICSEMSEILQLGGARVTTRIYDNCSHTDPILEGPLSGDDTLIVDIINIVMRITDPTTQSNEEYKERGQFDHSDNMQLNKLQAKETPMIPHWLAALARIINPF